MPKVESGCASQPQPASSGASPSRFPAGPAFGLGIIAALAGLWAIEASQSPAAALQGPIADRAPGKSLDVRIRDGESPQTNLSATWRLPAAITEEEFATRNRDLERELNYWQEEASRRRLVFERALLDGRARGEIESGIDSQLRLRLWERAEYRVQDVGAELYVLRGRK